MDPTTASYYRAILFMDSQEMKPLPPSLVLLHAWAIKRCQAMGLGSTIAKHSALAVAMTWLSSTKDGRAFARENTKLGELFEEPEPVISFVSKVDWETIEPESKVIVMVENKPIQGEFIIQRGGGWIDVRVSGEVQKFRASQVHIAGA